MDAKMILNKIEITPCLLYPTETIAGIDDKRVKQCYDAYVSGKGQICEVLVVRYEECLYIYSGHEQVLAAINFGLEKLDAIEINRKTLRFWADDKAFVNTLRDIGITAIYDFETVGGFSYEKYPSYYINA